MSIIKIRQDNEFVDVPTLEGPVGTSVSAINAGTPTVSEGYTNTPITFVLDNGEQQTVNVSASNGYTKSELVDLIYPIDSIYISLGSTNPEVLFGGTWAQISGRFLLASGGGYSLGDYAGEATHTLTIEEMPSHNHTLIWASSSQFGDSYARLVSSNIPDVSSQVTNDSMYSTGGSQPHNNMPPYLVVNMWRRIG